jgi:hypothetical protein
MQCMACGGDMRVVRIEQDHSMAVPGFKRQTLKCTGCQDTEQRLVFDRPAAKLEAFHDAPPIANEGAADLKEGEELLRQAMDKVRGPENAKARSDWLSTVAKLRGKS